MLTFQVNNFEHFFLSSISSGQVCEFFKDYGLRYNKQLKKRKNSLSDNCKGRTIQFCLLLKDYQYNNVLWKQFSDVFRLLPPKFSYNIWTQFKHIAKRKYKLLIWNAQSYAIVKDNHFLKRHLLDNLQIVANYNLQHL